MLLYSIGILVYVACIWAVSPFHKKARLMVKGHRQIYSTLKQKVDPSARYLWFHAASLGEFEQGRPIIEAVKSRYPQYKILLTFFSPSGYEVRKDYKYADIVCYMPFDTTLSARKFLNTVPVEKAFFIKYEFWPHFLCQMTNRGIKAYSISSIFRSNQYIFKWYGAYMKRALKKFTHIYAQDSNSKVLLETIGITNVTTVGDTRADCVLQIADAASPHPLVEQFAKGNKVFIAGSSWQPDERLFIPLFEQKPDWKLIIAPHVLSQTHLQSLDSALQGRNVLYLSKATAENVLEADVLIIDCFGLLSSIYRYGTIAYIGGGFGAGIHNTLEAAVYGIPVIFGPNNKRFREAQDLMSLEAAFQITDAESLAQIVNKFILDPDYLRQCGKRASDYVKASRGTADRIISSLNLQD